MRKPCLAVALIALGLLPASAPPRAQTLPAPNETAKLYDGARKEGTLTWYGGAPLVPMQGMAKQFEAKYPGVKVNIIRIVGAAQYQRYMQETQAGQYIADVLHIGDEPSMAELVEHGYIVDWKVPSFDRVPPSARIGTNAYTAYIIDCTIAYNPNKVSPQEVAILAHDWSGLLDPRFKGRIAITDQRAGSAISAIEMFLDPRYKDRFGLTYLRALAAQHPAVYNDIQVPADRVIAGENDIALFMAEGGLVDQWRSGAPIRWLHVAPTPAFGNTWFGISKHAPHPYAARLFLNWMMGDDGAHAVQTAYGGVATLQGTRDERPVTRQPWYVPITEPYHIDWKRWASDSVKDYNSWIDLVKSAH